MPMPKDRDRRISLAPDVQVIVQQSSAHPVEYAITLLALREGSWHAVRSFDNAHKTEEHHEHRYHADEKEQPPVVVHGPINEAMNAALVKIRCSWPDILQSWEQTR
jgi:hypothetical protein